MLPAKIHLFPSSLGWMALVTAGTTVKRLTFGHPSAAAAHAALGPDAANAVSTNTNANPLVARLQAYANGGAGRLARRRGRFRLRRHLPGDRAQAVPPREIRRDDHLCGIGCQVGLCARRPCRGQLYGREPCSFDRSMPSGGVFQRPPRFLLSRRRCGNETPSLGPRSVEVT